MEHEYLPVTACGTTYNVDIPLIMCSFSSQSACDDYSHPLVQLQLVVIQLLYPLSFLCSFSFYQAVFCIVILIPTGNTFVSSSPYRLANKWVAVLRFQHVTLVFYYKPIVHVHFLVNCVDPHFFDLQMLSSLVKGHLLSLLTSAWSEDFRQGIHFTLNTPMKLRHLILLLIKYYSCSYITVKPATSPLDVI